MNQWVLAFLIWWLGTGTLIVAGVFADGLKRRGRV